MLTLHFDYVSAASAVAVLRLQALADEGAAVAFDGFDPLGLDTALPVTLDQLAELDAHAPAARELGLALRRPSRRPPTLRAHVLGRHAAEQGLGASWRSVCLRAYWEDDADLGDHEVLAALATRAGLARDAAVRVLADRAAAVQLRQRMLLTRSRGVGGVPVLEVDGGTFVPADLPDDDLRTLAAL